MLFFLNSVYGFYIYNRVGHNYVGFESGTIEMPGLAATDFAASVDFLVMKSNKPLQMSITDPKTGKALALHANHYDIVGKKITGGLHQSFKLVLNSNDQLYLLVEDKYVSYNPVTKRFIALPWSNRAFGDDNSLFDIYYQISTPAVPVGLGNLFNEDDILAPLVPKQAILTPEKPKELVSPLDMILDQAEADILRPLSKDYAKEIGAAAGSHAAQKFAGAAGEEAGRKAALKKAPALSINGMPNIKELLKVGKEAGRIAGGKIGMREGKKEGAAAAKYEAIKAKRNYDIGTATVLGGVHGEKAGRVIGEIIGSAAGEKAALVIAKAIADADSAKDRIINSTPLLSKEAVDKIHKNAKDTSANALTEYKLKTAPQDIYSTPQANRIENMTLDILKDEDGKRAEVANIILSNLPEKYDSKKENNIKMKNILYYSKERPDVAHLFSLASDSGIPDGELNQKIRDNTIKKLKHDSIYGYNESPKILPSLNPIEDAECDKLDKYRNVMIDSINASFKERCMKKSGYKNVVDEIAKKNKETVLRSRNPLSANMTAFN